MGDPFGLDKEYSDDSKRNSKWLLTGYNSLSRILFCVLLKKRIAMKRPFLVYLNTGRTTHIITIAMNRKPVG